MTNAAIRWLKETYQPNPDELRTRKLYPFFIVAIGIAVLIGGFALGGAWVPTGLQFAVVTLTFGIFTFGLAANWSIILAFVGFLVPMILLFTVTIPCVGNHESVPLAVDLINGAASVLLIVLSVFGPGQRTVYRP